MNWLALTATVAYPVLAHLAALLHWPWIQAAALIMLGAVILLPRAVAWRVLLCFVVVAALLWGGGIADAVGRAPAQLASATRWLGFLVPVIVHGLVGWVFMRSLLPGREPLVTAIGRRARGVLPDAMQRYTRQVTQLWAGLFAVLLVLSIVLPFVSFVLWTWCTNVFNYLLIALLMAGEFAWRRRQFPSHDHPSFINYLRIVVQADVRQL